MLYVTGLALVSGAVIGLATGGRFRFIGQHQLRSWWLVVVGFGAQLAADRLNVGAWGTVIVLAGAAALLLFAAANPSLVGIGVVAVGVAANALVIAVNNGMPVRPAAVVAAHIATTAELPVLDYGYRHHPEGPGDQIRLLDDRIPLPEVHEVLSFGDLILAVGVAATVAHLLQPVPRHSGHSTPQPPARAPAPVAPAPPRPSPPRTTARPAPPRAETPPGPTPSPVAPAPPRRPPDQWDRWAERQE